MTETLAAGTRETQSGDVNWESLAAAFRGSDAWTDDGWTWGTKLPNRRKR